MLVPSGKSGLLDQLVVSIIIMKVYLLFIQFYLFIKSAENIGGHVEKRGKQVRHLWLLVLVFLIPKGWV